MAFLRDVPFLLRLRRIAALAAMIGGLLVAVAFIAGNPNWPWLNWRSFDLVRELVQCGRRAGAGALGAVLSVSAGIAVMALGSSRRLRERYLRKVVVAYIFAIGAMVVATGDGQDCNFDEIAARYSRPARSP